MIIEKVNEVCAVFICYFPDRNLLEHALDALRPQVGVVVIVDNGAQPDVRLWFKEQAQLHAIVHLVPGSNIGIAGGQNLGARWATINGFSHVLLMDQDSVSRPRMVWQLHSALTRLNRSGRKAAAIGPRIIDARNGKPYPFIRLGVISNKITVPDDYSEPIQTDILISSGTLISVKTLTIVGDMDESLFIDNVDIEWCFRAASMGFALYGLPGATMQHCLGDSFVMLWFFGWRQIIVHKPLRLYYIMRNRIRLYARKSTPRLWIAQDIPRLFAKLLIFSFIVAPRRKNLMMMGRGLIDAFAKSNNHAEK